MAPPSEFRQVGRHRRHLAHRPHEVNRWAWELFAAQFGQVAPSDDAQLCRQCLEQHGDQVRHHHDPQQRVAELGTRLDVGREVARVHVGDRGDHRGAGEQ